jgi:N utilization substance protein B
MRTVARETLFKIVFSSLFNDGVDDGVKRALFKADNLDENDREYCERVLKNIEEHQADLYSVLDSHSRLFPESRLFPADKSVLLIALAEIYYCEDIPSAVSVNEAVNIASKYSSEKSASFVNGLLAEIVRGKDND